MSVHVFGIRHHGPGSGRALLEALNKLQPDVLLVEGPPEAESILEFAGSLEMEPPVAILAYSPDNLKMAAFYPFAEFSPEWVAIQYSRQNNITFRFMDLPLMNNFAIEKNEVEEEITKDKEAATAGSVEELIAGNEGNLIEATEEEIEKNPLQYLAEAAGYMDAEQWWDQMFEQRPDVTDSFEAVMEGMQALRETLQTKETSITLLREAYMRKVIRWAEKENFKRIAVVCGAWHAPALAKMPSKKQDDDLLKNLPKVKVSCTWIPWTNSRLAFESGYGAGIHSPGWYSHLWRNPHEQGELWLTKVAHLFRQKNMDISTAHVIEASRLAQGLALLRGKTKPGLEELNEAALSVICFGDEILLKLIRQEIIIGHSMGQVPLSAPQVPLQHDLDKQQRKLRLQPKAEDKDYVLDLREANDLERSKLLHRLGILGINWGKPRHISGKGTFKEQWQLRWEPELLIKVIEMGIWGNTIEEASSAFLQYTARHSTSLKEVAELLDKSIPASLPSALEKLMSRIADLSAVSADIQQLMQSVVPLAKVARYGNVRKTDLDAVQHIVDGLITRISIGLPNACYSLDEDSAAEMLNLIDAVHGAVALLQSDEQMKQWHDALLTLIKKEFVHGLVAGGSSRLLSQNNIISNEEVEKQFSLALSTAQEPAYAATWLEGFLKGSGMVLLLDDKLWHLVDNWLTQLDKDIFVQLLPLLRRNFSTFSPPERRKMGERVKAGTNQVAAGILAENMDDLFDYELAKKALPVVVRLLGLKA